jgi:hypothetical protein
MERKHRKPLTDEEIRLYVEKVETILRTEQHLFEDDTSPITESLVLKIDINWEWFARSCPSAEDIQREIAKRKAIRGVRARANKRQWVTEAVGGKPALQIVEPKKQDPTRHLLQSNGGAS